MKNQPIAKIARMAAGIIKPALAILGALAISTTHAQWTGGGDGTSWNDAANWGGTLPTSTSNVTINSSTLPVGATISSGEVNILGLSMGVSPGTAALTINNTGTLHIGTGAIRFSQNLMAYLTVTDNARLIMDAVNVDFGYNNGSLIAEISGNARVENTGTGAVVVGERTGGLQTITVKDNAIWTMVGNMSASPTGLSLGWVTGTTQFTIQDNARVSVTNGAVVLAYGAGSINTMTLSGTADGARGTLETKSGVTVNATNANTKLVFDGGILRATGSNANFVRGGPLQIITQGNGAYIDSNGFDIGIASVVASFSGTSGLTKLGAGDLKLNNAITYTGTTAINAGSLTLATANQLATSTGMNLAATGTLTAVNLAQTLNGLSGAGVANLGTGAATLGGTGSTTFSGLLTAASITKTGAGTLILTGSNNIAGNTTINAGVLAIGNDYALGALTNKIIMTGGAVRSTTSTTLHNAIEAQGGAALAFENNGKSTIASTLTGANGITKTGTGATLLTGDLSAVTGNITVNQGGLYTTNYTGNVTIASGAAFGGAGTINGDVAYLGAGALQIGLTHNDPTVTTSSTLTITGSLGFAGAATLRYDMYAAGIDTLVAGKVGFDNATNTIDLVNIQTGTFTLFKLTSGTFDSALISGITTTQDGGGALNLRANASYQLSDDKTELQLISGKTSHVVAWTGATDGNWDSSTDNWTGGDTAFLNGDKISFAATGDHDIAIMTTGVVASEMAITGNGSYTFTGGMLAVDKASAGSLGASFGGTAPNGNFTIDTTGTVTLANDERNRFVNGITLQQGTLIGTVDTLGDANIANNGKTIFDQAADAIYTGTMTGSGILGKTGAAALQIGNNLSAFTGATELSGGTFAIADSTTYNSTAITGSNTNLHIGNNALVSASTAIRDGSVSIGDNSRSGAVTITGIGDITLGTSSTITGNATAGSGTGNITIGGASVINGNATTSNGDITLGQNSRITGNVKAVGSTITLANSSTIAGTVNLSAPAGGPVYLVMGTNSRIVGSATMTSHNYLYMEGGAKVAGSVYAWGYGEITLRPDSEIDGDLTLRMGGNLIGAGTIKGIVQTSTLSNNATITIGVPALNSYSAYTTSNTTTLTIGGLAVSGSTTVQGSGTLKTPYVSFSNELKVNTLGTGTEAPVLHITGTLTGSGTLTKTGTGTLILDAPSAYTGQTIVNQGTLQAGTAGALAPNSAFTVAQGANLSLAGYDHTLASLVNNGRVYIGANNIPAAGAKLKITGPYTSNLGGISLNIVAADNTKTLSDQLIFANAANITGTTKVYVQFTDHRTDWTRVVYDIDPLITAETGAIAPGSFKLDDGRGYERVIMSQRDYIINYTEDGVELVATTAAEMPAALAANAISIMANRATLGSLTQRLDYLRLADALPDNEKTGIQVWGQGYYNKADLDATLYPNSDGSVWGFQAGIDKRSDKAGKVYTTYGAFADHTEATADLSMKTSTDLSTTGLGVYLSTHTANDWHTDLVARYSWDKYKINVGHSAMDADGYTWGAMLRTAKNVDLGKSWTLTPQLQFIYQNRKVNDATDDAGRTYTFGPDHMRINDPSSFEARAGLSLRKIIMLNDTLSLAPYIGAHYLYEFKGSLAVTSVNNTTVTDDFGKDSYLFNAGIPLRLGRRIDIYLEANAQTGGLIESYGLNLGANYRW